MARSHRYRWTRESATEWAVKDHRGYTGSIERVGGVEPYQLTISPGAIVSTHNTLKNSKNEYRKFLHDKPVSAYGDVESNNILNEDGGGMLQEDGSSLNLE